MAYQKLQVGRALSVIPSDTVLIPNVSTEVLSGQADFQVANQLTDVGTTFESVISSAPDRDWETDKALPTCNF